MLGQAQAAKSGADTGCARHWLKATGQGRASVSGRQAPVRICEGALSGPEEEHGTDHHAVCAVQLMDGAQQIDAGTGVSASENGVRALNSEKSLLKCLKTPGFQAVGREISAFEKPRAATPV